VDTTDLLSSTFRAMKLLQKQEGGAQHRQGIERGEETTAHAGPKKTPKKVLFYNVGYLASWYLWLSLVYGHGASKARKQADMRACR
jgi:hypothetical protein